MSDPEASKKDQLQELLSQVPAASDEVESIGKSYVQSARRIRDISTPLVQVVQRLSDSDLPPEFWDQQIQSLRTWIDTSNVAMQQQTLCNSLAIATSGTVNTTNYAMTSMPEYIVKRTGVADNRKRILQAIEQQPLVENVRKHLLRLRLDARLLNEASGALERPVHGDGGPVSVLITFRECIGSILGELLRRRPTQEPASKYADKVNSIARQCARGDVPVGHFGRVAMESDGLMNQLSAVKQAAIPRDNIKELFNNGLTFLDALLGGLDESKLRQ